MTMRYGMDEQVGQIVYDEAHTQFLGDGLAMRPVLREHSEATAREIDLAVKALVDEAYARATRILTERRALLEEGVRLLLEKETLGADELPFAPVPSSRDVPSTAQTVPAQPAWPA